MIQAKVIIRTLVLLTLALACTTVGAETRKDFDSAYNIEAVERTAETD